MIKIGINGFGRIGRLVCRNVLAMKKQGIKICVVAINHLRTPEYLAYQFKYDTVHGNYQGTIEADTNSLIIDGMKIYVSHCRDPIDIPWSKTGAEYICECTGLFKNIEDNNKHLEAGAKKVVISAPPKDNIPMYVMGVNHNEYKGENIISNSSCTTNCLAPIAEIVNRHFGIEMGLMTTVHSMTANQLTVDGGAKGGKDWRSGRAASANIIPTSTGAAKSVAHVIPELQGKLTGMAFRVPTTNVSVVDLTCTLKSGNLKDVVKTIREESEKERYQGIVGLTDEKLVSSDFIGNDCSCILDVDSCIELDKDKANANNNMLKLVAWYDNEWAYSKRLVELILVISN